jgi:phage protein D
MKQYDVFLNGSPLPDYALPHLFEVSVDEDVAAPSLFVLRLAEADDLDRLFRWIDDAALFAIGTAVEIRFGQPGALQSVMTGEITALEADFGGGRPSLTVRGYDRRHRLQRGRKTRSFVEQTDSDIAAQIAREAGLRAQCETTATMLDYVLQNNRTDFEFLQERAGRIGYEVTVEDRTLFFRPSGNAASDTLSLTFGADLFEFSPRLSTTGQVASVTVRDWDPRRKKLIVATADRPDARMGGKQSGSELVTAAFGAAALVEIGHSAASEDEAQTIARGLFNRMALELIVGEGTCAGSANLRAGKVIGLRGLGERFSGSYYVTRAIHHVTADRGYETRFEVRRTTL